MTPIWSVSPESSGMPRSREMRSVVRLYRRHPGSPNQEPLDWMRGRGYSWAATYGGGTHPLSQTQGATSCGSSSRGQRAVKTNVAACQREGPPKISHPSAGALRTMAGGPACRWIGQSSLCASWQLLQEPTSLRTAALAANAFASFLNEAGSPLGGSFLGRSAASLL